MQNSRHSDDSVHFHRDKTPSSSTKPDDLDDIDLNESVEFDITFLKPGGSRRRTARNTMNQSPQNHDDVHLDHLDGDIGSSGAFNGNASSSSRAATYGYSSFNNLAESDDKENDPTYTIEEAIEHMGYGRFQIRVSAIAGLAWTTDAMEMMVLAMLSPALQCSWGLQKWELSLITSVIFVGMLFGASVWGVISDKYGRKIALVLSAVVCLYYGFLSALAVSLPWLLIFRMFVGFGVAGGNNAVTLYSEFLPMKARAKSIVGIEVFWVLGSGLTTLLAYVVMPNLGWRWLLCFSAIPLSVFILACKWLPESMRFNLSRGHVNEAIKTLEICAAENKKSMPPGRLIPPPKQERRGKLSDLFSGDLRRTTLLLWYIWFANTFCYYGIVLVTTELLDLQGDNACEAISSGHIDKVQCSLDCRPLTGSNYLELLWTTAAEFPGLIITFLIIDRIGRKWSSCSLFIAFAISSGLVAICQGRVLMIIFLFCARGFISGAWQVAFVYAPEIYPTTCRGIGMGLCQSLAKFGAVVTPFVAQVLLEQSIYSTIGIYTVVAVLAGLASLLLPVETKGRNLSEHAGDMHG